MLGMGDWSHEVHDDATLAGDYASLPETKQVDAYTWVGSRILLERTLPGTSGISDDMRRCAACDSVETACIYVHYFHHIVESDITLELRCEQCGKFTVHHYERL